MACSLTSTAASAVPLSAGPATMCLWAYRPSGTLPIHVYLHNGNTGLNGWGIYAAAGATSQFGIIMGGLSLGTNVAMPVDAWNHLMLVRNNVGTSDYRLYLNGSLVRTENWTAITPTSTNPWGGTTLVSIAEVGWWNVVLSAREITSLAKGFAPNRIRPQSLRGYVPMRSGTFQELTGRFTLTGSPTKVTHPRIIP